jgi:hypothetical protein
VPFSLGYACLNGPIVIAFAQTILFIGFLCSLITMSDCRFVRVQGTSVSSEFQYADTFLSGWLEGNDTPLMGLGYYTFQLPNKGCYWYSNSTLDNPAVLRAYVDVLGDAWSLGRAVGTTASALALLLWIYMMSYICTAQARPFRYALVLALCIVLVTIQGLTLTIVGSSWCKEQKCSLSRSAWFCIGAMVCYFVAGISFFCTKDYPPSEKEKSNRNMESHEEGAHGKDTSEADIDDQKENDILTKYNLGNRENVISRDNDSFIGYEMSIDGSLYIESDVEDNCSKSIRSNLSG